MVTKMETISKPLTRPIQSDHLLIADSDDTALGAGTLTVHSWRAGPDCGKFIYLFYLLLCCICPNFHFSHFRCLSSFERRAKDVTGPE